MSLSHRKIFVDYQLEDWYTSESGFEDLPKEAFMDVIKEFKKYIYFLPVVAFSFILCAFVGNGNKLYFEEYSFIYGVAGCFIWGIAEMYVPYFRNRGFLS